MMTQDIGGGGGVRKPTTSNTKTNTKSNTNKSSNNTAPSGSYTSNNYGGGSTSSYDGGSSYIYVSPPPPPPNPKERYKSPVIGPYVSSCNSHDSIYDSLNKKQTVKSLATSNNGGYGSGNYSLLYASTTTNLSKSQTELVSNNVNTDSLHKAAAVAVVLKPYLRYSLAISSAFPPATPFIAVANVLADAIIVTSGLDSIQKAFADDNQTSFERIENAVIGFGETVIGIVGSISDILYYENSKTNNNIETHIDANNDVEENFEFKLDIENNKATYPGDNPTNPPGEDWRWKGGENGSWYNPNTGESLHPDLNHPEGIEKHWDYQIRGEDNSKYRIFQDGHIEKK